MSNLLQQVLPLSWRACLSHIEVVERAYYWLTIFGRPDIQISGSGIVLKMPYGTGKEYIEAMRTGLYESEELGLIGKALTESAGAFLDVGANIGWYSFHAAQTGRRVFAIEPARDCLKYLRLNLKLNPLLAGKITIEPVAASDTTGTAVFHHAFVGIGGHSLLKAHKSYRSYQVQTVLLDDIIDQPVSAAKIDVEGNEPRVLIGMKRIISNWHPALQIECLEEGLIAGGHSINSLLNILREYNYTPYIVGGDEEPATEVLIQKRLQYIRKKGMLAIDLFCPRDGK